MTENKNNKLIRKQGGELLVAEAWGKNGLRIRATRLSELLNENWALLEDKNYEPSITVFPDGDESEAPRFTMNDYDVRIAACIENGAIRMLLTAGGKMIFTNKEGSLLLAEYESDRHTSLGIRTRELKNERGDSFSASMKWLSDPKEKLYGMGQYQNGILNLKGSFLELAQRNSQASVPFVVSSLGYGYLWNNPAIGKASFGYNMTEWEAESTKQIDFWITAGDTPEEILHNYMEVTGLPPVMPEHGLGFWQCKLRYRTQEELLEVAREYHRRGIPLDVIVADFFHWTLEGTWAFDPVYWPDPAGMVKELESMGTKLMVSVWPTVSIYAPSYWELRENGCLISIERGAGVSNLGFDPTTILDVTNPAATEYLLRKIEENYMNYGINDFWLDVAEPEFGGYSFDNIRYYKGAGLEVSNQYPVYYTKAFYEALEKRGYKTINLVRCAWAGSQKYGALVWSGDIPSTFESFRIQIICGLQMAMAGIPWWTTDIGGFHDGNVEDPIFRELLIRWFEYATFCPVMRMHGNRNPQMPPMSESGGGRCGSGAPNEIWSYGEQNYEIMKSHIELRNRLKPYIRNVMDRVSAEGCPVIRPLFYDFPEDTNCWEIEDQFMFGDDILVAPVVKYGKRERTVYLPERVNWINVYDGKVYDGGQYFNCNAPLEHIPVFVREDNAALKQYFAETSIC